MKRFKNYQCNGEVCKPLFFVEEGRDPLDSTVNFCQVEEGSGVLPEGWLFYPNERKLRCPRCVKHKEAKDG